MEQIAIAVRQIIVDKLGVAETQLGNHISLSDDIGADSLDLMEVYGQLEKEFDIKIPDEDAEKLITVGHVINYVAVQKS